MQWQTSDGAWQRVSIEEVQVELMDVYVALESLLSCLDRIKQSIRSGQVLGSREVAANQEEFCQDLEPELAAKGELIEAMRGIFGDPYCLAHVLLNLVQIQSEWLWVCEVQAWLETCEEDEWVADCKAAWSQACQAVRKIRSQSRQAVKEEKKQWSFHPRWHVESQKTVLVFWDDPTGVLRVKHLCLILGAAVMHVLLCFQHVWNMLRYAYQGHRATRTDAGADILYALRCMLQRLVLGTLLLPVLTLCALYGVLDPMRGRLLVHRVERWMDPKLLIARCFEPQPMPVKAWCYWAHLKSHADASHDAPARRSERREDVAVLGTS